MKKDSATSKRLRNLCLDILWMKSWTNFEQTRSLVAVLIYHLAPTFGLLYLRDGKDSQNVYLVSNPFVPISPAAILKLIFPTPTHNAPIPSSTNAYIVPAVPGQTLPYDLPSKTHRASHNKPRYYQATCSAVLNNNVRDR